MFLKAYFNPDGAHGPFTVKFLAVLPVRRGSNSIGSRKGTDRGAIIAMLIFAARRSRKSLNSMRGDLIVKEARCFGIGVFTVCASPPLECL